MLHVLQVVVGKIMHVCIQNSCLHSNTDFQQAYLSKKDYFWLLLKVSFISFSGGKTTDFTCTLLKYRNKNIVSVFL